MADFKGLISKFGFSTLLLVLGLFLLYVAATTGQNNMVLIGIVTIVVCAILISLSNAGLIRIKLVFPVIALVVLGALFFAWMDYDSVQNKLEFVKQQKYRELKVVARLMDIRDAQVTYKKVHGEYAGSFDDLINHVKYDSISVVKAMGTVPDTLTELKAVELGIVSRDTFKISVKDTLFGNNFAVDSLRYVPFSGGQEYRLQAGEIEKNKLTVKVFEAFASYDKILKGMNLSEEYVNVEEGLSVGSMTEPHIRGNWE